MDIRTRVAELRAYVRGHSLSQEKLAREAGISYSWLAKFAQSQRSTLNPRVDTLAKLEDYFLRDRDRGGDRAA